MADSLGSELLAIGRNAAGEFLGSAADALGSRGEDEKRAEAAGRFDWRMVALIVGGVVVAIIVSRKLIR
jgi:hypothetical protein